MGKGIPYGSVSKGSTYWYWPDRCLYGAYFSRYWLCSAGICNRYTAFLPHYQLRQLVCYADGLQRATAMSVVPLRIERTIRCCCYVTYNLYAVILKKLITIRETKKLVLANITPISVMGMRFYKECQNSRYKLTLPLFR